MLITTRCMAVLDRMPAFAKKERNTEKQMESMLDATDGSPAISSPAPAPVVPATPTAPQPAPEMDLLSDILGGSAPAPAVPTGVPATPPPAAGGMDSMLMDLLGSGPPAPSPAPATPDVLSGMMGGMSMGGGGAPGAFAPFQAFSKGGLTAMFAVTKDPNNASISLIEATFNNSNPVAIDGLNFQVAVPKYMKLQMSPASGTNVPAMNGGSVKQSFKVMNSMHNQKPLLLRIKVDFSMNGQAFSETGQVDNFPAGC